MTSAAFCSPVTFGQARAFHRPATCASRPRMCSPPSVPSVKLELDAVFSSISPSSHASTSPPPPPPVVSDEARAEAVEAAYRAAKAAYKEAKAVAKALRKREEERLGKEAYKEEKAARKAEKERLKALERGMNGSVGVMAPPGEGCAAVSGVAGVTVCGGKTCKRLGAEAVADVLRRARKDVVGAVEVDAPCMKLCGGVGPTVDVGGRKVKVDFRAAVLGALVGEEEWQR